eukprot:IDg6856t1
MQYSAEMGEEILNGVGGIADADSPTQHASTLPSADV